MSTGYSRRRFLHSSLVLGAGLGLGLSGLPPSGRARATNAPEGGYAMSQLTGRISPVHDPAIIKAGATYYLFCTATGLEVRKSTDLLQWQMARPPVVFGGVPRWAREVGIGATNLWAPDISFYNDTYHLYYSVSTFGSNRSAIGLATNATLDREEEGWGWVDHGPVIESFTTDDYNCIDPNLIIDEDGAPWLVFGSFWSGIKMRRLDYETGLLSTEDETLYSLATRNVNSRSVEAPFMIRKGDHYYLFVSFDFCCRGVDSTYRVMVGRSEKVTGPFVDRDGVEMLEGGGTQVTFPTGRWRGPGHNCILQDEDGDYIIYHAYDAENNGTPTLRIDPLEWDDDGWPFIPPQEEEE